MEEHTTTPANRPSDILKAWTAFEVLNPSGYDPDSLAEERNDLLVVGEDGVPWDVPTERRQDYILYHEVVLGSIEQDAAFSLISRVFPDDRPERPFSPGRARLASVILDRKGRYALDSTVEVSSFAWGVSRTMAGEIDRLSDWSLSAAALRMELASRLSSLDDDGNPAPLTYRDLKAAFKWLVSAVGIPKDISISPIHCVRRWRYYPHPDHPKNDPVPRPNILNSFFLADLAEADDLVATGAAPPNLMRYLGRRDWRAPDDVLADGRILSKLLEPSAFPASRWPGPGRHPLVLMQQAAVNHAASTDEDIIAVNGPPGTGKTTLLRDLVAATILERARAMSAFEDPAHAFAKTKLEYRFGDFVFQLHEIDETLKGFEIVVASSNNKAVENVSAELPAAGAIDPALHDLSHFGTTYGIVRGQPTWGAISAVMGRKSSIKEFADKFWWHKETGLNGYLKHAGGTASAASATTEAEDSPGGPVEARRRWQAARRTFLDAVGRVEKAVLLFETDRSDMVSLKEVFEASLVAEKDVADEETRSRAAVRDAAQARIAVYDARAKALAAREGILVHSSGRPGWISLIFLRSRHAAWKETLKTLELVLFEADVEIASAEGEVVRLDAEVAARRDGEEDARRRLSECRAAIDEVLGRVGDVVRKPFGEIVTKGYLLKDHQKAHASAPTFDDVLNRMRDDVFVASVRLHKAFVDAAAYAVRHNVGALLNILMEGGRTEEAFLSKLPHLWATFHCLVPVTSTTFASFRRMLGAMPPRSIGTVLVDEAGQATPQMALGAAIRGRRLVVVGDPLQVEPVVILPEVLTSKICRHFDVDPVRHAAPAGSVQTHADAASRLVATISGENRSRRVGIPLLVHRRCAEPMFGVSNAIAYEGLMVHAKTSWRSPIRDLLGPSSWIHVAGFSTDKWVREEGGVVIEMIVRMLDADVVPDLYVVTPFRRVQSEMRRMLKESKVLAGRVPDAGRWIEERVGTVHTVQGREAEGVILLLGAGGGEEGARLWAGGRPNLLNVAATRAKEVLYVVGNRRLWRDAGHFSTLDEALPPF